MQYDPFALTFSQSRKNLHWPEVDSLIDDIKKQGYTKILDIGCGNGRLLDAIRSNGLKIDDYLGIDSSEIMLEEARKLHPTNRFHTLSMEDTGEDTVVEKRYYEALVFLASFHHLDTREKRRKTLECAKNLLSKNGRIYMTNWNLLDQEKYSQSRKENGDFDIKIGEYSRYYHGFSIDELGELFSEAGYTIKKNEIFAGGRNIISILEYRQ